MRVPTFTAKASLARPSRSYGTWARDVLCTADFSTVGAEPTPAAIDTELGVPADEGGVEENGYENALEFEETGSEGISDVGPLEEDPESGGVEETAEAEETGDTD
jgi:hypothetical protein